MTPMPTNLQHMVQDLQDHDDWYEDEPQLLQQRHLTSPQADEDGFIPVPPPRGTRAQQQPLIPRQVLQTPTPPAPSPRHTNMYQALMDEARNQMTEHAKTLELAAEEQHSTPRSSTDRDSYYSKDGSS